MTLIVYGGLNQVICLFLDLPSVVFFVLFLANSVVSVNTAVAFSDHRFRWISIYGTNFSVSIWEVTKEDKRIAKKLEFSDRINVTSNNKAHISRRGRQPRKNY